METIKFEKDGIEYSGRLATQEEKGKAKSKGLQEGCECGEELCDGEWLWRCMASGGGKCEWYITDIVCP